MSKASESIETTQPDAPVDTPDANRQLFEVRQIPGKGRGLVAICDIPQGTRIILEKPIIKVKPMAPDQVETFMATKLKELSKEEQRQILSFPNNFPGKQVFNGILKTNSLRCGNLKRVHAIFLNVSLINHSCVANAHNSWNRTAKHQTIHAIRDIAAGEEITRLYERGDSITAPRRAALKHIWGFDCQCQLCTGGEAAIRESDERRKRMGELYRAIANPGRMSRYPHESLADCQQLINLLQDEYGGTAGNRVAVTYYDAFQISVAHGDQARARIFANRARESRNLCEGPETFEAIRMGKLSLKPSIHGTYLLCSAKWKRAPDNIPTDLEPDRFENWLFRL